jgi:hypothetical protein
MQKRITRRAEMKFLYSIVSVVLVLSWTPAVFAEDNSCWIEAPVQDDVWVIVYDADVDGNRGDIIWQGKIPAGDKIKISSTDGHIRYEYRLDPDQPYEGDVSIGCFGQRSISVD